MVNSLTRLAAALVAALALATAAAWAAPGDDKILPAEKYTTDKARRLASAHAKALSDLSKVIYNCVPWVDVQRESIGFFRPLHIQHDERYLSMRIFVEQDPSPEFQALKTADRASAMFSRYAASMLKRMAASAALVADPNLDGFTLILGWQKQGVKGPEGAPIHETIAIFIAKPVAADYLSARIAVSELAHRSKVFGFDGTTALGELKLRGWPDSFVYTYKVKDYQPDPSISCVP